MMNGAGYRSAATSGVVLAIVVVVLSRSLSAADAVAVAGFNSSVLYDGAQTRNKSSDERRQQQLYLRGERSSAVITERLPDIKVREIVTGQVFVILGN